MFRILGEDALYIDIARTFGRRLLELASPDDDKERLLSEIVGRSEVTYMLNGTTEEHTFFIRVPEDVTPEQIQDMADASLAILGRNVESVPPVEVNGVRQKYQVVITNWEEPEIIGKNKTPGMSSGEVFKPIFQSLDAPGRMNSDQQDQYFLRSKHESAGRLGVPGTPSSSLWAEPLPSNPASKSVGWSTAHASPTSATKDGSMSTT